MEGRNNNKDNKSRFYEAMAPFSKPNSQPSALKLVQKIERRRGSQSDMLNQKLKKKLTWAPDAKLCQVRLFSSKDSPSQVGKAAQDHFQARVSWRLVHTSGVQNHIQAKASSDQLKIKLHKIPLIKWKTPPKFVPTSHWRVVDGEESKETEIQKKREMREMEAFYPRPSSIPPNPSFPVELEDSLCDDDHCISVIPTTFIEDEDVSDPSLVTMTSSSSHIPPLPQRLLGSGTICSIPEAPRNENPAVGIVPSAGPDIVVVGSATFMAILRSNGQESLVDPELLVKIQSNPNQIEKVVTEQSAPQPSSVPLITNVVASTMHPPPLGFPQAPPPSVKATQTLEFPQEPPPSVKAPLPLGFPQEPPPSMKAPPHLGFPQAPPQAPPPSIKAPPPLEFPQAPPLSMKAPPPLGFPEVPPPSVKAPRSLRFPQAPPPSVQAPPLLGFPQARLPCMRTPPPLGFRQAPPPSVKAPLPLGFPQVPPPNVKALPTKDLNYSRTLIQQYGRGKADGQDQTLPQYGQDQTLPKFGSHLNYNPSGLKTELLHGSQPRDTKPKEKKPCIYFNSSRGCMHGANCLYQHDAFLQQRIGNLSEAESAKKMKIDNRENTGSS